MMFYLCLFASGFCGLAVVYPYLIYGRILRLLPTQPLRPDSRFRASITLVFCAYNEAASLDEKLENIALLKARHPDLEVLAFDDGSTDGSLEMMNRRPELLKVISGGGRNGKAHGMKLLAAQAAGDILVFTDANVCLREDALDALLAWYGDPEVGGVCGSLNYLGADSSATAAVGASYWKLEEKLKAEESRTGNVMGADGSIFSIRRSLYPDFPDTVLDDLTVSMNVVFSQKRLIIVDDVVAYEKLVAKRSDEMSRKARIAARAYHTHKYLSPKLHNLSAIDKFKYWSRKTLRWHGGLFLAASVALFIMALLHISIAASIVAVLVIGFVLFVGGRKDNGLLASAVEVIGALLMTQLGVFRAMKGQTFAVWNPAKSR